MTADRLAALERARDEARNTYGEALTDYMMAPFGPAKAAALLVLTDTLDRLRYAEQAVALERAARVCLDVAQTYVDRARVEDPDYANRYDDICMGAQNCEAAIRALVPEGKSDTGRHMHNFWCGWGSNCERAPGGEERQRT